MCASVTLATRAREQGILRNQPVFRGGGQPRVRPSVPRPACPTYLESQAFRRLLKCQRNTCSPANRSPIIRYAIKPLYSVQIAGVAHNAVITAMAPLTAKNTHQICVTRRV